MAELKLGYGVLSPHLHIQLKQQGFDVPFKVAEHWESLRKAEITLRLSGVMTDSVSDKVLAKLHKRITDYLNKYTTEAK